MYIAWFQLKEWKSAFLAWGCNLFLGLPSTPSSPECPAHPSPNSFPKPTATQDLSHTAQLYLLWITEDLVCTVNTCTCSLKTIPQWAANWEKEILTQNYAETEEILNSITSAFTVTRWERYILSPHQNIGTLLLLFYKTHVCILPGTGINALLFYTASQVALARKVLLYSYSPCTA